MPRLSTRVTLAFVESSSVIDAENVPDTVGVPLIVPLELTESPPGNPVADHVYGGTPPVPARVVEYGVPTVPDGKVVVAIVIGGGAAAAAALNPAISMA